MDDIASDEWIAAIKPKRSNLTKDMNKWCRSQCKSKRGIEWDVARELEEFMINGGLVLDLEHSRPVYYFKNMDIAMLFKLTYA